MIVKNKTTAENRVFWKHVEETAAFVNAHPAAFFGRVQKTETLTKAERLQTLQSKSSLPLRTILSHRECVLSASHVTAKFSEKTTAL